MKLHYYPLFAILLLFTSLFPACSDDTPEPEVESVVTIDPSSITIPKSTFIGYRLTLKVGDVDWRAADVDWSTGDERIATVDKAGIVTGVAAGETEITGTLRNGKGAAKCKVVVSDDNNYKFRLTLRDKGTSSFSINKPEEFLSPKAIERRKKRNIPIDNSDLPISADYIKKIEELGGVVVAQSKWLNTVTVHVTQELVMYKYKELPFVADAVVVWQGKRDDEASLKVKTQSAVMDEPLSEYGTAWANINMNNGQILHEKGFKGAGIDVAVIDAGFINIKTNPSLGNVNIKGAKSFIHGESNPFATDSHGIWVTSCMATNKPGSYIGTAPEANYWLLRTEDQTSEYQVEEDYWAAAIEYADSVGVDIVNTSLYYTHYKYEERDGKTAMSTRAANKATEKGIFIVACAGNDQTWVGAPADSPNVLAVGSVSESGRIDSFSSYGITVDGRIKPDVVALGGGASVIGIDGNAMFRSGTSYASPIMCGLAACLWQAYPQLTNKQLLDIIRKSANRYDNPEMPFGYGLPDMQKAFQLAEIATSSK